MSYAAKRSRMPYFSARLSLLERLRQRGICKGQKAFIKNIFQWSLLLWRDYWHRCSFIILQLGYLGRGELQWKCWDWKLFKLYKNICAKIWHSSACFFPGMSYLKDVLCLYWFLNLLHDAVWLMSVGKIFCRKAIRLLSAQKEMPTRFLQPSGREWRQMCSSEG